MIRKVNGMTSHPATEHRASVLEEIRLIIVEALRNNDVIRPHSLARIVAKSYPSKQTETVRWLLGALKTGTRVACGVLRVSAPNIKSPISSGAAGYQCSIHSGSDRIVMGQRDDFSESTIEAMMAAQRTPPLPEPGIPSISAGF